MSPMYKPFSTPAYILSPRRSLIISATLHPNSLSYLQYKRWRRGLLVFRDISCCHFSGLEVSPRHQHVNEGGSIALETPGAHRIGDWRLGY
uniref:Uncharacterized protein n=1 Tax=Salix viminalis TaxID=40686 RepID=A0A6N2LJH7_SALVM